VATTWQISVAKLGPQARDLLRLLAFVAPDPLPRWVLEQAGEAIGLIAGAEPLSRIGVTRVLAELGRYSLATLDPEAVSVHRLVQTVQRDAMSEDERGAWAERAIDLLADAFPTPDYSNVAICEALVPHALVCSDRAEKLGLVSRAAGLLPGQAGAFYAGRGQMSAAEPMCVRANAAFQRLAASDPGNAQWQRDLSVSHDRIGDVRVAQGDLAGALRAFEADLEIAGRLAASDPGNAGWQRDLAVSYYKLYGVASEAGQQAEAVQHLLRCREVLRGMKARGMHLDPPIAQLLEQLEQMPG
jgi:tetratricopeptide (TPR) repeat protein